MIIAGTIRTLFSESSGVGIMENGMMWNLSSAAARVPPLCSK